MYRNSHDCTAHSFCNISNRVNVSHMIPRCRVPCDHIPLRSWPLFKARDVMRGVIESFRAESTQ